MSNRIEYLRTLAETASEKEVIVEYKDGTIVNLGSHKAMIERQIEIEEMADGIIEMMDFSDVHLQE